MWSMKSLMPIVAVAMALFTRAAIAANQFHLSLVGDADYMLDWVTPTADEPSILVYGTSATQLNQQIKAKSAGTVEQSAGAEVTCWSALLHNLEQGATIYYALKGATDAASEPPLSFTVPAKSITWAVFGDLAAPMQKRAAAVSLPALKSELLSGAFQGVLNIGDISYELVTENGENYMNELETILRQVPMQTTVGNHEYEHAMAPQFALQNYQRRFAGLALGAGATSGSASNEFFSFASGLVHFVFINTEIYGGESFFAQQADGSWTGSESARRSAATAQAAWLEYDLSRVDRVKTPYVVMCGHRPPFKTPEALTSPGNKFMKEIVPLMSQYDVDLYLSGHEHTYLMFEESTVGGYRIPPIIISGSSGNNEYIRAESQLKIVGFKYKTLIPKYGFGYLTATETALQWKWGSTATDGSTKPTPRDWELEDSVTIPRRDIASATEKKGTPVKEPEPVETQWGSESSLGSSGANSGSTGSGPGTVKPAGSNSTTASSSTKPVASSPVPSSQASAAGPSRSTNSVLPAQLAGIAVVGLLAALL